MIAMTESEALCTDHVTVAMS